LWYTAKIIARISLIPYQFVVI